MRNTLPDEDSQKRVAAYFSRHAWCIFCPTQRAMRHDPLPRGPEPANDIACRHCGEPGCSEHCEIWQ
jgi:hypothetical protein